MNREPLDLLSPPPPNERAVIRYRRHRYSPVLSLLLALCVILFAVTLTVLVLHANEMPDATDEGTETGAATTETPVAPPKDPDNGVGSTLYDFDPGKVPDGEIGLRPVDLSAKDGLLVNRTDYTPDITALLESTARPAGGTVDASRLPSGPLVLILHTHSTEGYSEGGAISAKAEGEFARTGDPSENVVSVGAALAESLERAGIGVLHCAILHDTENGLGAYSGSYARAAETIARYLASYPSIRYVIDLHRDAVFDENGNALRAVTEVDGLAVAQVMAVVGSDQNGTDCPWQSNLALALGLTQRLNAEYESLARKVLLQASSYNQEFAVNSLLLEIGTAANSREEALRAAQLVGEMLAVLILERETIAMG